MQSGTESYYGDVDGHRSTESPDAVMLTYGYDRPLVTSEQWSGSLPGNATLAVAHAYNREFLDSTLTVGSTSAVTFNHDSDGLLTAAGALAIHRLATNGLVDSTHAGSVNSSYDYNPHGELQNLRYAGPGDTLFQQSLARDAVGRIVTLAELAFGTTHTYGFRYDVAGRLYGVTTDGDTTARYRYDANGNRVSFTGASATDTASADYDDQDRLLRYGRVRYEWTAAGELLRKITATPDTTGYTYDALGNLVAVAFPSRDTLRYVIDGANRRVARKWNGSPTGGWVYRNGLNPVAELDGSGAVVNRYVYGEEDHVPALLLRGTSTYRLITDYLGSVRGVVDVSTGAVVQRRSYDTWGIVTTESAPDFQGLGYAGGLYEPATGLTRFGARDYEAGVGRWTSKDPLLFLGNDVSFLGHARLQLYEYAGSDPIDAIDPEGLQAFDSYTAAIEQCLRLPTAQQREECLRALVDVTEDQQGRLQKLIARQVRQQKTANEILCEEIKGSAQREFPSQFRGRTLEDIMRLARRGDPAARKALKLLTDSRFRK